MRATFAIAGALAFVNFLYAATAQNTTAVTPVLTPIFTAHVYLGGLVGPIPIYGGAQVGQCP
jgi:hypothetical protein